jgi:hypothetical protein
MDESPQVTTGSQPDASNALDNASQPFIGQWYRLISTTNWEKGRIISHWRAALIAAGAPSSEYSDDAWATRVGGVSGQHVGRLRRVNQRFAEVYEQYPGLYWSHFQAALDWDDAEMWLEGAVHKKWSVSQMRQTRWETLGAVADEQPGEDDLVVAEFDEDFEPEGPASEQGAQQVEAAGEQPSETESAAGKAQQPADEPSDEISSPSAGATMMDEPQQATMDVVQPFADLKDLPEDLAEAFEDFKLAILRHKAEDWAQVAADDVIASLEALKQLVLAPSTDAAPF